MKNKRIIIAGGVAAGASAAARARRLSEHAEIILIERGPDVSFANCGLPISSAAKSSSARRSPCKRRRRSARQRHRRMAGL